MKLVEWFSFRFYTNPLISEIQVSDTIFVTEMWIIKDFGVIFENYWV